MNKQITNKWITGITLILVLCIGVMGLVGCVKDEDKQPLKNEPTTDQIAGCMEKDWVENGVPDDAFTSNDLPENQPSRP